MTDDEATRQSSTNARVRTPAQNAVLALLLEVASTPKPGNVDRERDLGDLRFEHFLAGAVGALPGFDAAAQGDSIGQSFEQAVAGMSSQSGGNTQFGALLLLTPLVQTAATGSLTPERAREVTANTTTADAAAFYRAFEHVDVRLGEPPEDIDAPDARRGEGAVDDVSAADLTLADVMTQSATVDGIAREWTTDFERSFEVADFLGRVSGPISTRAAAAYLRQLSTVPDTHVARRHCKKTASQVMVRAQEAREGDRAHVRAFADALVEEGINPGTTADIVAGGLFIALERGIDI